MNIPDTPSARVADLPISPTSRLRSAWAVMVPMPGKGRVLEGALDRLGVERFVPTVAQARGNGAMVPAAMFPGYVFVRPPVGRRHYALFEARDGRELAGLAASVLDRVMLDRVIYLMRLVAAEYENVKRAEKANEYKAKAPRILRSFGDLAIDDFVEAVDKHNLDRLFHVLTMAGIAHTATTAEYCRTDDLAEPAEHQCHCIS